MKNRILLIVFSALLWSCGTEPEPKPEEESAIVGEWAQTGGGEIIDGVIYEKFKYGCSYLFKKDGTGWFYKYASSFPEFYHQSFEWSLSGDKLTFKNWNLLSGSPPQVELGLHFPDIDNLTVLLLTQEELTISHWMLPVEWPGVTPEEPYESAMVFQRVR